jgi:hypothetical protein
VDVSFHSISLCFILFQIKEKLKIFFCEGVSNSLHFILIIILGKSEGGRCRYFINRRGRN